MTPLARRVLAVSASVGVVVAGAVVAPSAALAAPVAGAPFLAPYYTELDVTGDAQVTTADLEALAPHLGATSGMAAWADAARFDLDDDGAVTASDLARLSERIIYDDGPFEHWSPRRRGRASDSVSPRWSAFPSQPGCCSSPAS